MYVYKCIHIHIPAKRMSVSTFLPRVRPWKLMNASSVAAHAESMTLTCNYAICMYVCMCVCIFVCMYVCV